MNDIMEMTAEEIYDKLVNEDRITTLTGHIRFHFDDIEIVVKKKDVVGNIVEEWLGGWLTDRDVYHEPNPNTQMPPDFFLVPNDRTVGRLEIKAFNYAESPGFDIADFKAFTEDLIEQPYHLDTDFLIFGYTMDEQTGDVVVRKVWLKKIWEITKAMSNWPITVQFKNNKVEKMRPGKWYTHAPSFPVFENKEDYLAAFEEMVYQCPDTRTQGAQWRNRFRRSYQNHYGTDIRFPRWNDIEEKYRTKVRA